ncbi:hypothetical protein GOODEAATRI_004390 [Goodea atripinnis]|uniref:TROVE domain-containing protein n=1 Tax=Goodea atripinnis TaxID=208336 RepID=A0ABV0NB32_9TELE
MTPQSSSLFPAQPSSLPSLQATSLSSTSSFLLSTDSALLSTQNKLLTTGSAGLGSSLTSTVPSHSLVPLLLAGDPLVNRFADPPSFLKHGLSGEKKRDKGEEDEEISEEMASSYEETSVAVYTRQELNIRITTNFLLALAASLASTKPHVRRYFCAAVQLPSDWLEIVRIYTTFHIEGGRVVVDKKQSEFISASQKAIPSGKEILVSILKKIPRGKRSRCHDWQTCTKKRMKLTLGVPFIYRMYKNNKAQLLKASKKLYTIELLDRYRKALETAVQISSCHNVPPLPGKTLIFVSASMWNDESWSRKQDFCLPQDPEEKDEEDKEEEGTTKCRRTKDEHDPLTPTVNNIITISHSWLDNDIDWAINNYRKGNNKKALCVNIFLPDRDMHAERDVLVRSVFPELRRRAAAHCLHLQEVELRWGVTEEESERAVELCLSEVCRSQLLVGILGERYGQVPPKPVLPDLPQYSWEDEEAETDLEVSEQKIHQGALQRQFFGRGKLLSSAVEKVEQVQNKGGMVLIEGGPGEGKTVFMVNLHCHVNRALPVCPSSFNPLFCNIRDLLSEFHSTLSETKKMPLVVLVDGVDLVLDGKGQFSSDWIPVLLPKVSLKERDLYSVLSTCNDLSSRDGQVTWEEVLQLSRKPEGRIPMAVFTRIVQNFQRYSVVRNYDG